MATRLSIMESDSLLRQSDSSWIVQFIGEIEVAIGELFDPSRNLQPVFEGLATDDRLKPTFDVIQILLPILNI